MRDDENKSDGLVVESDPIKSLRRCNAILFRGCSLEEAIARTPVFIDRQTGEVVRGAPDLSHVSNQYLRQLPESEWAAYGTRGLSLFTAFAGVAPDDGKVEPATIIPGR